MRKSKEAHPTYGGFITKLYDLDGNYEKTIEWSIGDDISQGIFGTWRRDFSPEALDFGIFGSVMIFNEYSWKEDQIDEILFGE